MADSQQDPPRVDEYSDARDDDAFWAAVELEREPAKQRWYLPGILLFVIFSVPWYFVPGEIGTMVAGLPLWVWVSLGCSVALSSLTALAVLRFWVDPKEKD